MNKDNPVQFGIIGVGRISKNEFAPALALASNAELAAAASRDIDRAKALNPKRAYSDYDSLLDDPEVEAVYIGTHNGLHRDLTISALKRGKHVLCEKPLACNAEECREMIQVAKEQDRHLLEAFMYRYHPCILEAKSMLDSGCIGELKTIQASFSFLLPDTGDVRFNPDWAGGGVFDVGCYCINACRYFFGAMPISVTAMGTFHPEHNVDVSLHGILNFGDGRHGVISCGFDGGVRNQIVANGSKGVLTLPNGFGVNNRPTAIHVKTGSDTKEIPFQPTNVYQLEIEDLARAARGSTPMLDAEEGLRNALVIDALLQSARTGGTPVSLE